MLAEAVLGNVIKYHGFPKTVVSDRDPCFLGKFWQALLTAFKTKQLLSSAYHPQTDGQTERVHCTIQQLLRCIV